MFKLVKKIILAAALTVASANMARAEECNHDAAQWLSRTTVYVYIPRDGLRPTINVLSCEGDKFFVFPTTGVSKETMCEVTGSKPHCFD